MAMQYEDDDKKSTQAGVLDIMRDVLEPMSSAGDRFGGFSKQFDAFTKGLGALESRFSRLTDVMDDFYTRMSKLSAIGEGGGAASESGSRRGLMDAGIQEQRRVLESMKEKWGKPYGGTGRPFAETEASRMTGWDIRDIKALRHSVESGRLSSLSEFKDMFTYMRAPTDMARAGQEAKGERWGRIEHLTEKPQTRPSSTSPTTAEYELERAVVDAMRNSTKGLPDELARSTKSSRSTGDTMDTGGGGGGGRGSGRGGNQQNQGGGSGGNQYGGGRGQMDLGKFLEFASPFSPMSLSWMAMFGMSGQLFPAAQMLAEPAMQGGEWNKQVIRGAVDFGGSFTGLGSLGKLFNKVATTDAFELYESMYSSFTVLKNVYKSQEKAAGSIEQSIQLARETPLEVNDLLKVFSTFSVNPQLRGVLSNREQMGQLATGVAGLSFLVPEQGTAGATFAIREAMAGQYRSIKNRFNINPELIAAAGGMSLGEMKMKPANFLGALDSFLKQNLGQQTFTELQMTFSKQVGNIFDALTGGIFKGFQQTGMYQGVTTMTAELSNVTQKFFGSNTFDEFFQDFGGKVSTQFSKATSIFKSINFETDTPEESKQKLAKGVQTMTKDLVYSLAPNMDTIISAISPVAKDIGSMVSTSLSKGMADVFGGAFSVGVSSIVNTLEMPFQGVGKSVMGEKNWAKMQGAQTDWITEHPLLTMIGGGIASKGLINQISGITKANGGLLPALANMWQGGGGANVGGMAATELINVLSGKTKGDIRPLLANAVQGGAKSGGVGGMLQKPLQTLGIGGVAGSAWRGLGLAMALPALWSAGSNIYESFGERSDPEANALKKYRSYKAGTTKLTDYYDEAYNDYINGWDYKTKPSGTGALIGMGLAGGMAGYSTVADKGFEKQQSRRAASFGQAESEGKYYKTKPTTLSTYVPYVTGEGARGIDTLGKTIMVPNMSAPVDEAGMKKLSTGAFKRAGLIRGIGAGIGLGALVGLSDYAASGVELTPDQSRLHQGAQGLGQGLMGVGGMVMMIPGAQLAGGITMAAGAAVSVGSNIAAWAFGGGGKSKEEFSKKQKGRLDEANKSVNDAIDIVINDRLNSVKDYGKLQDVKDVMNESWQVQADAKIEGMKSNKKVDGGMAAHLKKELPKIARQIIEGVIDINNFDLLGTLAERGALSEDKVKEFRGKSEEESLKAALTGYKGAYTQSSRPDYATQAKYAMDALVRNEMGSNLVMSGLNGIEPLKKDANVQGYVSQIQKGMGQSKNAIETLVAATRQYEKGGTWEEAKGWAQTATGAMGFENVDRAFELIRPLGMTRDKFVQNKAFNFETKAENLFNSDWISNIGQTSEGFRSVLRDTYQKQLLYFTKPSQQAYDKMVGQGGSLADIEGRLGGYVGANAYVAERLTSSMPEMVTPGVQGQMISARLESRNKATQQTIQDYMNIDKRVNELGQSWDSVIGTFGATTMPEVQNKVKEGFDKNFAALKDNMMSGWRESYKGQLKEYDAQVAAAGQAGGMAPSFNAKTPQDDKKLMSMFKQSEGNFDVFKNMAIEAGHPGGNWDDLRGVYQKASAMSKIDTIFQGNAGKELTNATSRDEVMKVLKTNLGSESAVKMATALEEQFSGFASNWGTIQKQQMGVTQQTLGLLGGQGFNGAAQPYTFTPGGLMRSSHVVAGQEMPNLWVQYEMQSQREKAILTPSEFKELDQAGGERRNTALSQYRQVLDLATQQVEGGGQVSPFLQGMLPTLREQVNKYGGGLEHGDIFKEAKLGLGLSGQLQTNAQTMLDALNRGDLQTAEKLWSEGGVGAAFKEGKTPMEQAAGMSGVGEALEKVAKAANITAEALAKIPDVVNQISGNGPGNPKGSVDGMNP